MVFGRRINEIKEIFADKEKYVVDETCRYVLQQFSPMSDISQQIHQKHSYQGPYIYSVLLRENFSLLSEY